MITKDVLKRLELLNNLISLKEFELLELQTCTLKAHQNVPELQPIIAALEDGAYGEVARMIRDFTANSAAVQAYEDPEIAGLRAESAILERKLVDIAQEKAEIEKRIHEFQIRYHQELGPLIEELLALRRDRLKEQAKSDADVQEEFAEADADYEKFHKIHEESKAELLLSLTDDEKQELKAAYRKASKLCHPDIAADDFKEEAEAVFKELADAYGRNDLQQVREILERLEKGIYPLRMGERIDDKEELRSLVRLLRRKMISFKKAIEDLLDSDAYRTLDGHGDWDSYLDDVKTKLQAELDALRQERSCE